MQQTLVDAVRGLPDFRGHSEAEFTAWLLKLLERNLLQSARLNTAEKRDVRREVVERSGDSSAQVVWHSLVGEGASPQTVVLSGEMVMQLATALDQLPPDQRTAVELRYLGQQPLQTIADEMHRSVSSIAGLIRRGLEALETHLPPELREHH